MGVGFLTLEPGDVLTYTVTGKAVQSDGSASDLRGETVEITVTHVERNEQLEILHIDGVITGGGRVHLRVVPDDFGDRPDGARRNLS